MSSRYYFSALILLSVLFAGAILPEEASGDTRADSGGYYGSERIYNSTRSLSGGMGAGDLDGDGEIEVAFCDFSGNVVMLEPRVEGGFRAMPIWELRNSKP